MLNITHDFTSERKAEDIYSNSEITDHYLPKYSQADLDLAIEQSQRKAYSEINLEANNAIISNLKIDYEKMRIQSEKSEKEISIKNNELIVLAGVIDELQQREKLNNIQTKALMHRIQTIEIDLDKSDSIRVKEIQALKNFHDSLIEKVNLDHKKELESMTLKLNDSFAFEMVSLKDKIKTLNLEKEELVNRLKRVEEKSLEETQIAVQEAKNKLYDKAKAQFEAGNKEFTKLKLLNKDLTSENESMRSDLESKNSAINDLKKEILSLKENYENLKVSSELSSSKHNELIESIIKQHGSSESSNEYTKDILVDKNTHAFSIINLIFSKYNDILSEKVNFLNKNVELDLSNSAKEQIIEKCKAQIEDLISEKQLQEIEKNDLLTEIDNLKSERDTQMTVMAKLMVENESSKMSKGNDDLNESNQQEVENLTKANLELEERCLNLRNMNEELLIMLEQLKGI